MAGTPKTRLKWPGFIYLDTRHQELFVADSFDDSILVFRATDSGDVAPIRVLKGSRTGLKNPYGVVVDQKNEELLVANYGNCTATVYPRTAAGDAPPIRTFRGAPEGTLVPIFQHVASMDYDTRRDEILVSSCIIHPQIAAFAKAETGEIPNRIIAGPAAGVARAMHNMRYDAVHDEIVAVTPFPQAILTFRGGANGEEPPLRIIQGSRTRMREPDIVVVDPVHDEIFVAELNGTILVFPRTANGNVAPIRVLTVPDVAHLQKIPLAVDPITDFLAVGSRGPNNQGQILIFNRTDQGNVEPRAVIAGPKTGLRNSPSVVAYPAKGWLLAGVSGGVGVWSVQDSGDVPPRSCWEACQAGISS